MSRTRTPLTLHTIMLYLKAALVRQDLLGVADLLAALEHQHGELAYDGTAEELEDDAVFAMAKLRRIVAAMEDQLPVAGCGDPECEDCNPETNLLPPTVDIESEAMQRLRDGMAKALGIPTDRLQIRTRPYDPAVPPTEDEPATLTNSDGEAVELTAAPDLSRMPGGLFLLGPPISE